MASSVQPLIQIALNTCQEHKDVELDMYCKTCNKAVCSECAKSKHLQHNWVPLSTYTRELRGRAQIRAAEVDSVADSMYKGRKEISDYWNNINEKECSKVLSELEVMRSRLHNQIDEIIYARKKEVQNFNDERKERLSPHALEKEFEKLKKMTLQLKEEGRRLSNSDIIELYDDIDKSLQAMTALSECSEDCFEHVIYEKGEDKKEKLVKMVGGIRRELVKVLGSSLTLLKELDFKEDAKSDSESIEDEETEKEKDYTIYCIRPVSDKSAWISCDFQCRNVNFESNSHEILKRLIVSDFDVFNTDTLISRDQKHQSIFKINTSDVEEVLFKTTPLIPIYLTITHSGDLLISLVDEVIPTRGPTSRRLLRRTTQTGLTLKEYEYDNDGETPLFTKPEQAVEHYHGQVCVINGFKNKDDQWRGTVYGIDPAGRVQYRYNNNNDEFYPLDICSDMIGNTLILDSDTLLHCVSSKGCLLKYLDLYTCFEIDPYSVALFKNTLWVGSHETGQVNVYEYNN